MDGGFWGAVWASTVANLATALLLGGVSIGLSAAYLVRRRRRLFRFFGLSGSDGELPQMRVLVSRLEIRPGGTQGMWGVDEAKNAQGGRRGYERAANRDCRGFAGKVPPGRAVWEESLPDLTEAGRRR